MSGLGARQIAALRELSGDPQGVGEPAGLLVGAGRAEQGVGAIAEQLEALGGGEVVAGGLVQLGGPHASDHPRLVGQRTGEVVERASCLGGQVKRSQLLGPPPCARQQRIGEQGRRRRLGRVRHLQHRRRLGDDAEQPGLLGVGRAGGASDELGRGIAVELDQRDRVEAGEHRRAEAAVAVLAVDHAEARQRLVVVDAEHDVVEAVAVDVADVQPEQVDRLVAAGAARRGQKAHGLELAAPEA